MKKLKVSIEHFTPSKTLIEAVRMPFDNEKADIDTVIKVIAKLKHTSVAEHLTFNFKIENVSRLLLQELVRHRIASYTVKSTRYTLKTFFNEITEQTIKEIFIYPNDKQDEITEQMIKENFIYPKDKQDDVHDYVWNKFIKSIEMFNKYSIQLIKLYSNLGIKPDNLKYFIPEGLSVKLMMSINFRSLLNFFELRRNNSAHFEIRNLANEMYSQVSKIPFVNKMLKIIFKNDINDKPKIKKKNN